MMAVSRQRTSEPGHQPPSLRPGAECHSRPQVRARATCGRLVAGALILVSMALAGCGKGRSSDRSMEAAVGEFLAEKITEAAPGGGTVVVLVQKGGGADVEEAAAAQLQGLRDGLGSSYSIKEVGPDLTTVKPGQESVVMKAMSQGWPMRAVYRWFQSDPGAVAVVSLMVSPMPKGLSKKLLAKLPPLFVLEPSPRKDLIELAEAGTIAGLAYPHDNFAEGKSRGTPEEIVASRYQYLPR